MKKLITKGEVFFWAMLALMAGCGYGCGSVKNTVKSDVKVNQVSTTNADSAKHAVTVSKNFGDILTAKNFIPFSFWHLDTSKNATPKKADTFNITTESQGIKHKQSFSPVYDHSKLIGLAEDDTTIAKPTKTTTTTEDKQSHVRTTTVKDSTAKVQSTTTKTLGFGLSLWEWVIVGLFALVLIYFIAKRFLKFL